MGLGDESQAICKNTPGLDQISLDENDVVLIALSLKRNPKDPLLPGHAGDRLELRVKSFAKMPSPGNIQLLVGAGAQGTNYVNVLEHAQQIENYVLWDDPDKKEGFMFPQYRQAAEDDLAHAWHNHNNNIRALQEARRVGFKKQDWNAYAIDVQKLIYVDPETQKSHHFQEFVTLLDAGIIRATLDHDSAGWLYKLLKLSERTARDKFTALRLSLREDAEKYAEKHPANKTMDGTEKELTIRISELHLFSELLIALWHAVTKTAGRLIFQYAGKPQFFIDCFELVGKERAVFVRAEFEFPNANLRSQERGESSRLDLNLMALMMQQQEQYVLVTTAVLAIMQQNDRHVGHYEIEQQDENEAQGADVEEKSSDAVYKLIRDLLQRSVEMNHAIAEEMSRSGVTLVSVSSRRRHEKQRSGAAPWTLSRTPVTESNGKSQQGKTAGALRLSRTPSAESS